MASKVFNHYPELLFEFKGLSDWRDIAEMQGKRTKKAKQVVSNALDRLHHWNTASDQAIAKVIEENLQLHFFNGQPFKFL